MRILVKIVWYGPIIWSDSGPSAADQRALMHPRLTSVFAQQPFLQLSEIKLQSVRTALFSNGLGLVLSRPMYGSSRRLGGSEVGKLIGWKNRQKRPSSHLRLISNNTQKRDSLQDPRNRNM
jgi:hypothetical protein